MKKKRNMDFNIKCMKHMNWKMPTENLGMFQNPLVKLSACEVHSDPNYLLTRW